jgi:hypothetical protein
MARDLVMVVQPSGPTTATCTCPCGQTFECDAVDEFNLVFDKGIKMLRAVCPRCARLEPFFQFSDGPMIRDGSPATGRIKELYDE